MAIGSATPNLHILDAGKYGIKMLSVGISRVSGIRMAPPGMPSTSTATAPA
jgi:hypothetical protein